MVTTYTSRTTTAKVLIVMNVLAWIAFIGFMIDAGAILTSYIASCFDLQLVKRMYKSLETSLVYTNGFEVYTFYVSFALALQVIKAYISFEVIKVLSRVSLRDPFTNNVARRLERISYVLFSAFLLGIIHNAYFGWLQKRTALSLDEWNTGELFAMAGLVFIISQVFRRGVELQAEADLTV